MSSLPRKPSALLKVASTEGRPSKVCLEPAGDEGSCRRSRHCQAVETARKSGQGSGQRVGEGAPVEEEQCCGTPG